jgi:mannose-1-phosphate guanylyltransferase
VNGRIGTAFVLGAGLGTRLRPLTLARPKPLIPIFGKPLITFALDHLCDIGVESFVINTHHLPGQIETLFRSQSYGGRGVRLLHEPNLLETGGGIKNAQPWIGQEPFIVYSGDLLTDIELEELIDEHFRRGNDVTLALRTTGLASGLALDRHGRISAIEPGRNRSGGYDFANVSIWNRDIFDRIPVGKKVSFVPVLIDWLRSGGKIGGVVLNEREWFNIGSRSEYLKVHEVISRRRWRPDYLQSEDWPVAVAADAQVAAGARLKGFYAIGSGCSVEGSTLIEDSILWEGATIRAGSILRSCVVAGSLVISGRHENADLTAAV